MPNNHTRSATIDCVVTLNRVLDEALSAGLAPVTRLWTPAIDIVEQKDAYVLYAELPGVDSSQIEMSFEKSVLTLRGEKRSATTDGLLVVTVPKAKAAQARRIGITTPARVEA